MKRISRTLLFAAAIASLQSSTFAAASAIWQPGFIIRAADRFDPAIQRLMAEHSLRSLPLERGQLYYLYPIGMTPRLEGMQIRYLETLLDKRAFNDRAAAETEATEEPETATEK